MRNPLCTFCLPARKRPEKLNRAIETIHQTAASRNFEIIVRLDEDDHENDDNMFRWTKENTVKFIIGKRYPYGELYKIQQDIINAGSGRWMWIFNDDFEMICDGEPWDVLLEKVPTTGYIVQPDIHKLGLSEYPNDRRSCAPCFPYGSWNLGPKNLGSQCDYEVPMALERKGWQYWFLPKVTVWHNRNSPAEIIREHQI